MVAGPRNDALAFSPMGLDGLLCQAPPPLSLTAQYRLWELGRHAQDIEHVVELVPGMNNLLVIFNAMAVSAEDLTARLAACWTRCKGSARTGKTIDLPVRYGGALGMDLGEVAHRADLSTEEVVRLHSAGHYVVFFLGAYPGLGFLGGLDNRIATPRRMEPRLRVPGGSVGIGGAQTAVLPTAMPSGWNIIGNTPVSLFDVAKNPPAALAPGDRVRFQVEKIES